MSQAPNFAELYTLFSIEANGLITIASSDMNARISHIGTDVQWKADPPKYILHAHQRKVGSRRIIKVSLETVETEESMPCRP